MDLLQVAHEANRRIVRRNLEERRGGIVMRIVTGSAFDLPIFEVKGISSIGYLVGGGAITQARVLVSRAKQPVLILNGDRVVVAEVRTDVSITRWH